MWRTKGHLSDKTVQGLCYQGKSWTPISQSTSCLAAADQVGCEWILPPPWPTQAEVGTVCDHSNCPSVEDKKYTILLSSAAVSPPVCPLFL